MWVVGSRPTASRAIRAVRALDAASGSQTITGVGFRPRTLQIKAFVNASQIKSDGWCDGALNQFSTFTVMNANSDFILYGTNNAAVGIYTDATASNNQVATVTALTSDGCTLSWVRSGSLSSGNIVMHCLFWR